MKIGVTFAVCATCLLQSLAFSQTTTQPATQPDSFRVVTLNCLWFKRATVADVAKVIAYHRADLVFLQEVHDNQAAAIAGELKMHRTEPATLLEHDDQLETAILSRQPLADVKILRTEHNAELRPSMGRIHTFGVEATTTLGEWKVRVISVHPKSSGLGATRWMLATIQQRVAEVTLLLGELKTLDGPVIVGGDFNEGADSVSLGRLKLVMGHAFSQAGHGSPVTFPGFANGIQIDHIYFNAKFRAVDCFVDPTNLSDHWMLVATLKNISVN